MIRVKISIEFGMYGIVSEGKDNSQRNTDVIIYTPQVAGGSI